MFVPGGDVVEYFGTTTGQQGQGPSTKTQRQDTELQANLRQTPSPRRARDQEAVHHVRALLEDFGELCAQLPDDGQLQLEEGLGLQILAEVAQGFGSEGARTTKA